MIVSDLSGTTTDAVDTIFEKNNQRYHIIDTAGMRRKKNFMKNMKSIVF